jgi:hypothetical protein
MLIQKLWWVVTNDLINFLISLHVHVVGHLRRLFFNRVWLRQIFLRCCVFLWILVLLLLDLLGLAVYVLDLLIQLLILLALLILLLFQFILILK